jgi:hypothetical protein
MMWFKTSLSEAFYLSILLILHPNDILYLAFAIPSCERHPENINLAPLIIPKQYIRNRLRAFPGGADR